MPTVLALYAGRAGTLTTERGEITTAIAKLPVAGRAHAGVLGLDGDEQIAPGHGGPDRAICVYPSEHYAHWDAQVAPAFGENVTARGVLEASTVIGETWRIGSALVQVSQPRSPCFKVAARLAIPGLVMHARRTAFTGLHLRVLEPGELGAGDTIELLERPGHGVTVADAVRARFSRAPGEGLVERVLAVPGLAAEWYGKTAPRLRRAA